MTLQLTDAAPLARHPMLRSIGAIAAGFATIAVLSTVGDQAMHNVGLYPERGMSDTMFAVALGYRALFGVLAGYVAARLAPNRKLGHAVVLGAIGLLLSTGGAVALWDAGPHWYPIAVALVCLPTAAIGASLVRSAR
jgi:hypothetical protein